MAPYTLPDITGDGASHSIAPTSSLKAKWIQLLADKNNSATPIRVGGPEVSATQGLPLIPGASMLYAQDAADMTCFYPLRSINYNAANGDKLYVQYGVD